MAVPGMREPCVSAVAEPLTLCLPPHTASLSLEGGREPGPRWPVLASLKQLWLALPPPETTQTLALYFS